MYEGGTPSCSSSFSLASTVYVGPLVSSARKIFSYSSLTSVLVGLIFFGSANK